MEDVPDDIDDICVNEVPQQADLSNCKAKRPWCKVQSSKPSAFTKGPRRIMNCRGSYIWFNKNCPNIPDIEVNRRDFMMENDISVCFIYSQVAKRLKSEARFIIEKGLRMKDLENMVKYFSIHTCLIRVHGRAQKAEVTK